MRLLSERASDGGDRGRHPDVERAHPGPASDGTKGRSGGHDGQGQRRGGAQKSEPTGARENRPHDLGGPHPERSKYADLTSTLLNAKHHAVENAQAREQTEGQDQRPQHRANVSDARRQHPGVEHHGIESPSALTADAGGNSLRRHARSRTQVVQGREKVVGLGQGGGEDGNRSAQVGGVAVDADHGQLARNAGDAHDHVVPGSQVALTG